MIPCARWPAALALAVPLGCVIVSGDAMGDTSSTGSGEPTPSTTEGTTEGTPADTSSSGGTADDSSTGEVGPVVLGCPEARAEVDRPDDSDAPQVRVLYVVPSDGRDAALDTSGQICNSVLGWTRWFDAQSGGRTLRLDTEGGRIDIGFVRLAIDDAQMHGTADVADVDTGFAYVRDRIERELAAMDEVAPDKIYAVYYGGTSQYACGGGAYPPLLVGHVAAMYLGGEIPGFDACNAQPWGQPDGALGYVDAGMLHEVLHTLGAVDLLAPHEHASGHAFDDGESAPERDLMYSPRTGGDPPWGVYDPDGLALDLGRDDYFDHGDPELLDVARSVFLEPMPDDAVAPPGW